MVQILEHTEGKIIAAKASKTIIASDYYKLLPLFVNRLKQYPNIRFYLDIDDLEGIDLHDLREEMNFNTGLANAFDKVALMGKKTDEPWVGDLLNHFTSAEVKWFDSIEKYEAIEWLTANRPKTKELTGFQTPSEINFVVSGG